MQEISPSWKDFDNFLRVAPSLTTPYSPEDESENLFRAKAIDKFENH